MYIFKIFDFLISFYLGKVHQRYVRNPAKDPLLLMEGTLPNYSDDQYVPAPAKIGIWLLFLKKGKRKDLRNLLNFNNYCFHYVIMIN